MSGIQKIVRLEHGVGILGKRYEDLLLAKRSLKVNWSKGASAEMFDSEKLLEEYARVAGSRKKGGHVLIQKGDAGSVLQKAHRTYSADFLSDHVYHAQMEPLNAVVAVNPAGDGAEIWAGTQSPMGAIKEVAKLLGTSPRKIKLHPCFLGGGFGRRSMSDYIVEAAELSKAVRKPVKLIWSREDDLQYGAFRPMCLQRLDAGMDADGNLIAWRHSIIGDGGRLLSSGAKTPYYDIPNQHIEIIGLNHGVRLKHWRAVGHGFTKFAIESFIDEIAASEGVDPYQFHRRVMRNSPRALKVLETAADLAGWGGTPSEGRAIGISFAERSGSMAACVAEVSVERSSGKIRVHRLWSSLDAGIIVQPDNAVAQMESAIIYGLSSVLSERVTFKDGKVQQSNFHDYRVMRMADAPEEIHVKLIDSNESPTGIGETGLPITGGAVANAVAALTGIRLRHLPFTPDRVKKALES
jgi:isoquinoline 1-oxidoreductase beta subunit